MDELFLVWGQIRKNEHAMDQQQFEDSRLVLANGPDEAEIKFVRFWEERPGEYSEHFKVLECKVKETI